MEEVLKKEKIAGWKRIPWGRMGLVATTLLLAGLYIWQVNLSSVRGYDLRELQSRISDQKIELERLDMETARLSSVDSVRNRVQMLGLVKPEHVNYISGTPTVAFR